MAYFPAPGANKSVKIIYLNCSGILKLSEETIYLLIFENIRILIQSYKRINLLQKETDINELKPYEPFSQLTSSCKTRIRFREGPLEK